MQRVTILLALGVTVLVAIGFTLGERQVAAARAQEKATAAQARANQTDEAAAKHRLTKTDVEQMMKDCSNWGRWGAEDQLGAVNLITPEKRKAAAALVKEGVSVSLAHDVEKDRAADNSQPFGHTMNRVPGNVWATDTFNVSFHGYCHTHLDALCHMFIDGQMYNGFPQSEVTDKGANKLAITNLKQGIFTRGILLDMPRLKGVRFLEPGTAIYPEDLDAWLAKANIKMAPGDVVFLYTGRWARRAAVGPWAVSQTTAGLHALCGKWLKTNDVAIIGSDAVSDVLPSGVQGVTQPIHQLTLVAMGMNIFDNCDLEALAEACAKYNRWEFLLTAAPMAVPGATGSPLNPVATF